MTIGLCDICQGTGHDSGICCGCGGTGYYPHHDTKEIPMNPVASVRKKLKGMPWRLPDPETALVQKIKEHERDLIAAEQARQYATATVDYHTRTAAALRAQLRNLQKIAQE